MGKLCRKTTSLFATDLQIEHNGNWTQFRLRAQVYQITYACDVYELVENYLPFRNTDKDTILLVSKVC